MEIVIKERIARRMRTDLAEVQVFFAHAKKGWDEDEVTNDIVLDLAKLTANEVKRLHEALSTSKILGTKVLAEYKERPLYSIQCSQLGIDPETIEKNLAVVLQRANRWNAILLLDEADVYITKRGSSLQHNAIVGVFLRILEYAQCILIMTTNLAANVDDAIASRCIVRIDYEVPSPDDQIQIWKQLAALNTIDITEATIRAFVAQHPEFSGRDVKNLLKLASFVAKRTGHPIDIRALEFALQYKPTTS